jgi:hypothetical protein
MRMETTISFYGKGNEIICFKRQLLLHAMSLSKNVSTNLLHQICMSQINNDNIHQGPKIIFDDDNTHSSLCTTLKRWETSLYM